MHVFFYWYGDHRTLHVITHSFPTLRSSDLRYSLNSSGALWTWNPCQQETSSESRFIRSKDGIYPPSYGSISQRKMCHRDWRSAASFPFAAGCCRLPPQRCPAPTIFRGVRGLTKSVRPAGRSEAHTSELQSLMRNSYAV